MLDGMADISLAGRLLIATPELAGSVFERAVILMLEHGAEGALGLILNRPMDLTVADAVAGWEPLATAPPVVFRGGPVSPGAAICLAAPAPTAVATGAPGWRPILPHLAVVDLTDEPSRAVGLVAKLRVFSGYAGWAPGQLEAELASESWLVVDSRPDDVFSERPERLWQDVLRRQHGQLAFLATLPADPSLN